MTEAQSSHDVSAVPGLNPTGSTVSHQAHPADLHARAVAKIKADRNSAIIAFLMSSAICWAIWFFSGTGFPWPIFVSLGGAWQVLTYLTTRDDLVAKQVVRLQKREQKALRKGTGAPELPPGETQ